MLSTQFCATCGAANEAARSHCFACGRSLSASTDIPADADSSLLHGRYRIEALLGSGGYSTVYRARDLQTEREVAIKQINLQGLSAEEAIEATDTFNREASVLSSLHHPQIPRMYDQFHDQDHWYLVLQYLEGPTLETYLETRETQNKPLQFDEVLRMALQLGKVLNYLHTRQPPVISSRAMSFARRRMRPCVWWILALRAAFVRVKNEIRRRWVRRATRLPNSMAVLKPHPAAISTVWAR